VPVTRLLVANRGEIAVRILHTATALGLPTVAVYATDEADAEHPRRADRAVALAGTGPAAYLDIAALVAAAVDNDCDAVHPGYGFLSERADFATACGKAGLTFVGPSPEALALFGDKARARQLAAEVDVDVLPGTEVLTGADPAADLATARQFLASLGTGAVVLVKAVAGGGGRGIRPVHGPDELAEVLDRCRSEAVHSFGDGGLYLERLLPGARHIEVQLLGDAEGTVIALGERDCSVQRRRQKLLEIAPAPGLTAADRAGLREAALRLGRAADRLGLATAEFLVTADEMVFLEVNARLQVEHTVTEEVTGLDLVELQLRVADGATLAELGLDPQHPPVARGVAVQARVNAETLGADGSVRPAGGTLTRFAPPTGRGVRVDTHAGTGREVSPRYDSLLAKVIVSDPGAGADQAGLVRVAALAGHALAGFEVAGTATNLGLLRALLAHPGIGNGALHTGFVDAHLTELLATAARYDAPHTAGGPDTVGAPENEHTAHTETEHPEGTVTAPLAGVVVELPVAPGEQRSGGATLVVLESMKMEHEVRAAGPVTVREVLVAIGAAVAEGTPLLTTDPAERTDGDLADAAAEDLDRVRPDLAESRDRHHVGLDEGRPDVVARRHDSGRRTARENLAQLCDPDTFTEYGALAIAAQRRRRTVPDLIAKTPADGLVVGTGVIGGIRAAVMSYDYTVLAGTQGVQNHRKTDRLFELARRQRLPVVMFAEGGGGRPGDTDQPGFTGLDVTTFRLAAELVGQVPTVAVVSGYCFAGNAALAGVCDVLIATPEASLGMGGPAMISGGGLGDVEPGAVGPMSVQVPNGVVDLLVADDEAAVATVRRYLSYCAGPDAEPAPGWECADQRRLRHLIPENRVRSYPIRPVLDTLFDTGSVLELRARYGVGILTAFARIEGHPVAVIANDPTHLGGAIDAEAADKVTRFLGICDAYRLPVVSLCDTPGFMVGPDAETTATVRRFGAMFVAGAQLRSPLCTVVLRKGYGLGAMAMAGGSFRAPLLMAAWPTGEFGGMGLEGSVQLGYRAELNAIDDPKARHTRYTELVERAYQHGKALSTAATFEIDDVIDPAETRTVLSRVFGWKK
jgi:acetyl/propionyl-CoA carboxylase alpha subunit/acetyl-CoA carboxylase carboxyltransferase component